MNSEELNKYTFNMEDDKGELVVKGDIIGETEIPFFDDLKFKAVVALLNSIDKQNFADSGKMEIFNHFITEIEETLNGIKKYNHFQGKLG
ncbi:hypothetical protein [Bacillus salipaludis]|uniref:hypothetical protein n=1 Tax=Bacillus salipaludis TaxID=2547811 RepID=UPI002E222634|nr:hypothetical protein [Bacillus salipaludis]